MRKLDSMNAQVSHLRKRIETTSSSYMNDEAELQSLISNKKKVIIIIIIIITCIIIIIVVYILYCDFLIRIISQCTISTI